MSDLAVVLVAALGAVTPGVYALVAQRSQELPPVFPQISYGKADNMEWHCDYCGRENTGDRLTCAGCGASRPQKKPVRLETLWKGKPISTLSEEEHAEMLAYLSPASAPKDIPGPYPRKRPDPLPLDYVFGDPKERKTRKRFLGLF